MTSESERKVWICWKKYSPWSWDGGSDETIEHIYNNEEKAKSWLKEHPGDDDTSYNIFIQNIE